MTAIIIIAVKWGSYALVEYLLGKTKWGSAIGLILSAFKREIL